MQIHTNTNGMITIGWLVLLAISGCSDRADQLEVKVSQLIHDKQELIQQNEILKKRVEELSEIVKTLRETDQQYFNRGVDAFDEGITEKNNRKSLILFETAIKYFTGLLQKYPDSKHRTDAELYNSKAKHSVDLIRKSLSIEDAIKDHDFSRAESELKESKGFITQDIYNKYAEQIKRGKNKPTIFHSHREFHRVASTGMEVEKRYAVYSALTDDGEMLCGNYTHSEIGSYCENTSTWVSVKNTFSGAQARDFYDMRGKYGCFVVHMEWGGQIWVDEFSIGRCSR